MVLITLTVMVLILITHIANLILNSIAVFHLTHVNHVSKQHGHHRFCQQVHAIHCSVKLLLQLLQIVAASDLKAGQEIFNTYGKSQVSDSYCQHCHVLPKTAVCVVL